MNEITLRELETALAEGILNYNEYLTLANFFLETEFYIIGEEID